MGEFEEFFSTHAGVTEYFNDCPAHERLVVFQRDVSSLSHAVADIDDPWATVLDALSRAVVVHDELLSLVLESSAWLQDGRTIK